MCLFWLDAVDLKRRNVRILTTMMMTMTMTITMTMTLRRRMCAYRAWGSG